MEESCRHNYLYHFKVKNSRMCIAKDAVSPIFGTMAHAVMPCITSDNQLFSKAVEVGYQLPLIFLPVKVDRGEKLLLKGNIQ